MKNTLKINHENRTLVMDRTFAKAASFVGSNEYNLLQDARRDYPSYQVPLRSIKKKEDQESYRGLTYLKKLRALVLEEERRGKGRK